MPGMTVDDVVEAIFRRLCDHQREHGIGADMSLAELRLAIGVTEAQLLEAVKVARLSDDLYIAFMARDRVTLGASWRGRCEDEGLAGRRATMGLRTPDQAVRAQIDTIKDHLRAEGLVDVEDPLELQKAVSEGFHTIWATFNNQRRALRLGYGWLQEQRADELAAWLTEKEIARRLKTDERVVTVRDSGLIQGFLEFPI